jgi:hypothetical protein
MRIAFIFLLTAVVATAQTSSTLRQKYGQPTSETYDGEPVEIYKVRPDIKVTVRYTKRGDVCSMFIGPVSETTNGKPFLLKSEPLDEVIDELVPEDQRGTHIMDTFLNITCLPNNDCYGTRKDYEQLLIVHNGSIDAYRYASIEWKHRKCLQRRRNAQNNRNATQQSLAAEGAIACFSSSLVPSARMLIARRS